MRTPMTRTRQLVAASLLAFTPAGCGDDADPSGDADPSVDVDMPGGADGADEPGDAGGEGNAVRVGDFAFEPADIEVAVGSEVTWTNEDAVSHTVTTGTPGEPDGTLDVELAGAGQSVTIAFDDPGTFDYYCDFHRSMVGTVDVTG